MDREILFRGNANGKWVEGQLVYETTTTPPTPIIVCGGAEWVDGNEWEIPEWYSVDPSTVGQYTGLKDRNGKRIFEGDIIKAWQVFCGELLCRGTVEYQNLRWEVPEDDFIVEESSCIEYEVIGNIHDNPELMEV